MIIYRQAFIGGRRVAPLGDLRIEVRSPFDGEVIGQAPLADEADVELAATTARRAFEARAWSEAGLTARLEVIERFCKLHAGIAQTLAGLVARQSALPIRSCLQIAHDTRLENAGQVAAARAGSSFALSETSGGTLIRRRPSGVVAAFAAWNAPQASALAWLLPALLAGCAVVLGLPTRCPLDGQRLGELFAEAGLPEGVLSILVLDEQLGLRLAGRQEVDRVAFAGDAATGRRLAAHCVQSLKRLTLDLDGRSTAILLPDAEVATVVAGLHESLFFASGQGRSNPTHLLVPRHRQWEVAEALAAMVATLPMGPPLDRQTMIGPLVSEAARAAVAAFIERGLADGATLVCGGSHHPDLGLPGAFLAPTVLANVAHDMSIAREPVAGPVATVTPYEDLDHAIRLANAAASVTRGEIWSSDPELAAAVAGRIRSGHISFNGARPDPAALVAGSRNGGFERTLTLPAVEAFSDIQTVTRS